MQNFRKHSLAAFLLTILVTPQAMPAEKAGKVILSKGDVNASDIGGEKRSLRRGKPVFSGDTITTGSDSLLQMNMLDDGMIALAENSIFSINDYSGGKVGDDDKKSIILDMVQGGFRAVTGEIGKSNPQAVKVRTGVASIGIRGTGYEVFIHDEVMYVDMLSGTIELTNNAGSLRIGEAEEYNFARVDGNNIKPTGIASLPLAAAQNNPFMAATEVPSTNRAFVVPNNERPLSDVLIRQLTNINPDENANKLTFTANPTDPDGSQPSDNGTGSETPTDSNPDTPDSSNSPTELSSSELEQIVASNIKSQVLLADENTPYKLLTGVDSDGNTSFFIEETATLNSYQQLIRPDQASNKDGYPKATAFDPQTTWGIWLATKDTPAANYSLVDGNLTSTPIEKSIYWITTTPATNLEATFTFLTTGAFEGESNLGDISSLTGGMRVNFDSSAVTLGYLNIATGDYQWITTFSGNVSSDSSGGLDGKFNLTGENQSGVLAGYFVKPNEVFFTGTYSLTNNDNDYVRGLVALEGFETILVYGGNDPSLEQFGTLVAFEGSALLHGPTVLDPLTTDQLGFNTLSGGITAGWYVEKPTNTTANSVELKRTLSDTTYWGVWNASTDNPGNLRYRTRDDKEYSSDITSPIYWMSTTASAITRVGTANFISNGDFIGSSNQGSITSLSANISFDFDSQLVTAGNLDISTSGNSNNWQFDFSGIDAANRTIDIQNGYFSVNQTQINADNSNGIFGRVEGYFVGTNQSDISAAFGLFRQGDGSYLDSVNGLFGLTEQ